MNKTSCSAALHLEEGMAFPCAMVSCPSWYHWRKEEDTYTYEEKELGAESWYTGNTEAHLHVGVV